MTNLKSMTVKLFLKEINKAISILKGETTNAMEFHKIIEDRINDFLQSFGLTYHPWEIMVEQYGKYQGYRYFHGLFKIEIKRVLDKRSHGNIWKTISVVFLPVTGYKPNTSLHTYLQLIQLEEMWNSAGGHLADINKYKKGIEYSTLQLNRTYKKIDTLKVKIKT